MKKLFLLAIVILAVFAVLNRQRLFLRDPLAKVDRDHVLESDTRVMINYSNDMLLEDLSGGHHRVYLIQNWNKIVGVPVELKCLTGIVCLTDADQATMTPIPAGPRGKRAPFSGVLMTNTQVQFLDEDGALVTVSLR